MNANWMRTLHGYLTVVWLLAAIPILASDLKNSVPVLVFISIYANVVGHWSSWQASRVEVRQEEIHQEEKAGSDPPLPATPEGDHLMDDRKPDKPAHDVKNPTELPDLKPGTDGLHNAEISEEQAKPKADAKDETKKE